MFRLLLLAVMLVVCCRADLLQELLAEGHFEGIAAGTSFTQPFLFYPPQTMLEHGSGFGLEVECTFRGLPCAGFLFIAAHGPAVPATAFGAWQNFTQPRLLADVPFYGVSYLQDFSYPQATLASYANESCAYAFTEQVRCRGWQAAGGLHTNVCATLELESEPLVTATSWYSVQLDARRLPLQNNCTTTVTVGTGSSKRSSTSHFLQTFTPVAASMPAVTCDLLPHSPLLPP